MRPNFPKLRSNDFSICLPKYTCSVEGNFEQNTCAKGQMHVKSVIISFCM